MKKFLNKVFVEKYIWWLGGIAAIQTGMTVLDYDMSRMGAWLSGYFVAAFVYRLRTDTHSL